MEQTTPDLTKAKGPPPTQELAGPSGARAGIYPALMLSLILLTALLVAVHTWASVAGAIALMLIGAGILTRYVQRVSWTRSSAQLLRSGLTGMHQDLSITDEAHDWISAHDLPIDNPTRPDVLRMEHDHSTHETGAPMATGARVDPFGPGPGDEPPAAAPVGPGTPLATGSETRRTASRRSRPGRPLQRRLHLPRRRRPGGQAAAGLSPERQSTGAGSGDRPQDGPRS